MPVGATGIAFSTTTHGTQLNAAFRIPVHVCACLRSVFMDL